MNTNTTEFNPFLKVSLILISVFSLIKSLNDTLDITATYGNNANLWVAFVFTCINAFSILYLLLKMKSIWGMIIFYISELSNSIFLFIVLDNRFNDILVGTLPRVLFLSLLLFIPYKGKIAWCILLKNKHV